MFDDLTGTLVIHVPYCSTGPSVAGPLAREVEWVFALVSAVETLIREGKVFILANTEAMRAQVWL